MVLFEHNLAKLSKDERARLVANSRQDAYKREGKLTYWMKYCALFTAGAALLGMLVGFTMSAFFRAPNSVTVAVAVGGMIAALSFDTRIEHWLLRKYISARLRSRMI